MTREMDVAVRLMGGAPAKNAYSIEGLPHHWKAIVNCPYCGNLYGFQIFPAKLHGAEVQCGQAGCGHSFVICYQEKG